MGGLCDRKNPDIVCQDALEIVNLLGLCSDCSVSLSAYFTIFMAKWPEDNVKLTADEGIV